MHIEIARLHHLEVVSEASVIAVGHETVEEHVFCVFPIDFSEPGAPLFKAVEETPWVSLGRNSSLKPEKEAVTLEWDLGAIALD